MTKPEIRALIQKGDLAKIERAIMNGYGERFLGETAMSTRVRDLLESIPEHLVNINFHWSVFAIAVFGLNYC